MKYKLRITKLIENPNYEQELEAQRNNQNNYGMSNYTIPSKTIEDDSFLATLTDEEFQAVKKAVLEIM